MTNEEAIEIIEGRNFYCIECIDRSEECCEALNMAIKALEQEPCEDCISRQDAEGIFREARRQLKPQDYKTAYEFNTRDLMLLNAEQLIHQLPPVTPQPSAKVDGDLISRDYVLSKFKEQCDRCGKYKENNGVMCRCCELDDAIDYVEDAPSAEKTAEWKDGYCSNCGCDVPAYIIDWKWQKDMSAKYCPNCGARMKGEQTE